MEKKPCGKQKKAARKDKVGMWRAGTMEGKELQRKLKILKENDETTGRRDKRQWKWIQEDKITRGGCCQGKGGNV